jgi:hypothetical protein
VRNESPSIQKNVAKIVCAAYSKGTVFLHPVFKIEHPDPEIANHNNPIMRRQSRHFGHVRGTGLWIMLVSLVLVLLAISIASRR